MNKFLDNIERYKLELNDLVKMHQEIAYALSQVPTNSESQEGYTVRVAKNFALNAQMMRYADALKISAAFIKAGYEQTAVKTNDWEGKICTLDKKCATIKPITALFFILQKIKDERPTPSIQWPVTARRTPVPAF